MNLKFKAKALIGRAEVTARCRRCGHITTKKMFRHRSFRCANCKNEVYYG